jgi:hypothetical protein
MKEAQRFPADFNGIIAGAPGLDWTGRAASANRIAQRLEQNEAARLGQPQRQLLHAAVVESCDLLDGVKDGVLKIRRSARSIRAYSSKGSGGSSCLTTPSGDGANDLFRRGESDEARDQRPRAAVSSDGPILDGRRRSAWINSGFSSSAIRAGPYRSSTGIPTSCSPRSGTTTP